MPQATESSVPPATVPPVPSPAPVATVNPGAILAWDEGILECGVNAKPAIDQDQHGNWWAYCEPALID